MESKYNADCHRLIRQQILELPGEPFSLDHDCSNIISCSVPGGLHHDYHRVALSLENAL
jgi:hypothetical protein